MVCGGRVARWERAAIRSECPPKEMRVGVRE